MKIVKAIIYLTALGVIGGIMGNDSRTPIFCDTNIGIEEKCNHKIEENKYAVMVIDMQTDCQYKSLESIPELSKLREITKWDEKIENQKKLLQYANENNIPVVVLELLMCGETIQEIKNMLKGSNYKTFRKVWDDGFLTTLNKEKRVDDEILENYLISLDVNTLILMGFHKYGCAYMTAKSGFDRGFSIITSPDLIIGGEERNLPYPVLATSRGMEETMDNFYQQNTIRYNSVDEVIKSIK